MKSSSEAKDLRDRAKIFKDKPNDSGYNPCGEIASRVSDVQIKKAA